MSDTESEGGDLCKKGGKRGLPARGKRRKASAQETPGGGIRPVSERRTPPKGRGEKNLKKKTNEVVSEAET